MRNILVKTPGFDQTRRSTMCRSGSMEAWKDQKPIEAEYVIELLRGHDADRSGSSSACDASQSFGNIIGDLDGMDRQLS